MRSRIYPSDISYIISVSVGTGCYRHLRISGKETLHGLADAILDAFDFDHDHLYAFFMDNKWWSRAAAYHSPHDNMPPFANTVKLAKLFLAKGQPFKFLYDFGDEWEFQCKVLQVLEEDTKRTEVIRSKGESPEQYPAYDDDFMFDSYAVDDDDFDEDDCFFDEDETDPADDMSGHAKITDISERRIPPITQTVNPDYRPEPEKPPLPEIPDELYEAAFQFRSDKLWKKLYDSELFAVRLSNGETGYCSVLGRMGEIFALNLYIGDIGFWSLEQIMDHSEGNPFLAALSQNCLQLELVSRRELQEPFAAAAKAYADAHDINLRGKNSFPSFIKCQSYLLPDDIRMPEDFRYMTEALRAAHEVAGKLKSIPKTQLGLDDKLHIIPLLTPEKKDFRWTTLKKPKDITFPYARPAVPEETVKAVCALPKKGTWESCMMIVSDPAEDAQGRIVFPPVLFCAGTAKKQNTQIAYTCYYPEAVDQLLSDFASHLLKTGVCPKKLRIKGMRTLAFFEELCEKCGIEIETAETLPKAEAMVNAYLKSHSGSDGGMLSQFSFVISMLDEMSDAEIRSMPKEMKEALRSLLNSGLLPDPLEKRLKKLL